jgi:hypothetical protein
MYTVFVSQKLLNVRDKEEEWFLKKHISTRERFEFYNEIYSRILKNAYGKIIIYDLGAGVNGFSYKFFKKINKNIFYVGVEAVGQLVKLMNSYFEKKNSDAIAIHESLFDLEKIKKILKEKKGTPMGVHPKGARPRKIFFKDFYKGHKIIFLFKTLDSLEMLKRDYSKVLLKEIVPLADKVVVSFATRSLISKKKFDVRRNWIINFIEDNFNILDKLEVGAEIYIVFCKKQNTTGVYPKRAREPASRPRKISEKIFYYGQNL